MVSQLDSDFVFKSKIVSFKDDATDESDFETFEDFSDDIRAIMVDQDFLWVSRRVQDTTSEIKEPKVTVHDKSTGDLIDTVGMETTGVSFAAGDTN